jgi:hypothetical protein
MPTLSIDARGRKMVELQPRLRRLGYADVAPRRHLRSDDAIRSQERT